METRIIGGRQKSELRCRESNLALVHHVNSGEPAKPSKTTEISPSFTKNVLNQGGFPSVSSIVVT
jgi:hypothetical protein